MSSRPARTLIAKAPDGTKLKMRTSGAYDFAGIVQVRTGRWSIVIKGWSQPSVDTRTRTYANRYREAVDDYRVVPLREEKPRTVEEYFAKRPRYLAETLRISQVFIPGVGGWKMTAGTDLGGYPSKARIRQLKAQGITNITVADADFGMDELLPPPARPRRRSHAFIPHLGV